MGIIINKLLVEMGKKTELQQVVRDYTLNLHKRLQGVQFKQRAPTAIKNIRKCASTLFLIDRSGLLASETFLVKCVSESQERETRMRRPRRNSIPSSNTSKLMASLNCRPRKLPERSGAL